MLNTLLALNQCIRCGKSRIITKTWREEKITYSTSACPDIECQKIVDADLQEKQVHLNLIKENSLKRQKMKRKS